VLRFICKHELTHIARPPRVINGEWESHPSEFWDLEESIGPEHYAVWAWLHRNLRRCTRNGSRGYTVLRRWSNFQESPRTPYTPELPWDAHRWVNACPGGEVQLRLPPGWVVRPLPATSQP
jgi:hypothetical protein